MTDSNDRTPNIEDRGKAEYFHGRKGILVDFKERLQFAEGDTGKGTTFLVQAAPGAGKTALLAECARRGKARGWQVAEIDPGGLLDPVELSRALRHPAPDKRRETSAAVDIKIFSGKSTSEYHMPQTVDILNSGKTPLLLLLDEAQDLRTSFSFQSKEFRIVSQCLKAIHNGKLDRPVILLSAGLSATAQAFSDLGVSRFKDNCYVELGRLRRKAERAVIADWLQLNGKAKGDPRIWIDAIAAEAYGWPQHVSAYAQVAAFQVRADRRKMTADGLEAVLRAGRVKRTKFYKSRAKGLKKKARQCIARAAVQLDADGHIDEDVLMAFLLEKFREDEAREIFTHALHKGVLDMQDGELVIPIPSMRDWFLENYLIERETP